MITDLNQIDTTTEEGKLLMGALAVITTTTAKDKTPYEVIDDLYKACEPMSFGKEKGIKILLESIDDSTETYLCDTTAYSECLKSFDLTNHPRGSFSFGSQTYIKNDNLDKLVKRSDALDYIFDAKPVPLSNASIEHIFVIPDEAKKEIKKPSERLCDSLKESVELAKELLVLKKQIDKYKN